MNWVSRDRDLVLSVKATHVHNCHKLLRNGDNWAVNAQYNTTYAISPTTFIIDLIASCSFSSVITKHNTNKGSIVLQHFVTYELIFFASVIAILYDVLCCCIMHSFVTCQILCQEITLCYRKLSFIGVHNSHSAGLVY